MERFWNIVYYFIHRADYRIHMFSNNINPILWLYRLPFARKHFEKKGVDPDEELNMIWTSPKFGLGITIAGGFMVFFVVLFFFGVVNIFKLVSNIDFVLTTYHFLILLLLAYIVNHFLLFKKDKYLQYFKDFDNMPQKERIRWIWITLGVILCIITFSVGSCVM